MRCPILLCHYIGPFSLPVFEVLSTGFSIALENNLNLETDEFISLIESKSKDLIDREEFINEYKNSSRPINRTKVMIEIGKELFSED